MCLFSSEILLSTVNINALDNGSMKLISGLLTVIIVPKSNWEEQGTVCLFALY